MTDDNAIAGTLDQIDRLVEGVRQTDEMMAADPANADLIEAHRVLMKVDTIKLLSELAERETGFDRRDALHRIEELRASLASDPVWCSNAERAVIYLRRLIIWGRTTGRLRLRVQAFGEKQDEVFWPQAGPVGDQRIPDTQARGLKETGSQGDT